MDRLLALLFLLGAAIRLVPAGLPVVTESWREADVSKIARNYFRGTTTFAMPQIDWRGDGPAAVFRRAQGVAAAAGAGGPRSSTRRRSSAPRTNSTPTAGEMAYLAPSDELRTHRADVIVSTPCTTVSFTPETLGQLSPGTRHLFDGAFIKVLVRRLHAAHEQLDHPRRIL